MSNGIVTAEAHPTFHNYAVPNLQASKTILHPYSHLTFDTNHRKRSLSLRTQSRSIKTTPILAAVSSPYVRRENFYDLLGISESGTLKDIKHAYKQLARKYHPDVSPPDRTDEYTKKFIEVQEAYETLSDPNTRALYDIDMARGSYLPFAARRPSHYNEGWLGGYDWKQQWQSQLTELQRSTNGDSKRKVSWGSRMRMRAQARNS
ncbi:hypothetical protein K2173_018903 [Erythroxylum novogranatense]|uniref:J domain-containing protein n=1 Tax=Erythroxylum novogranatense TaxID=1862640 RepID=A0AAV8SB90_9ROSI|nr:hypothetical protein K2173_018903 [Erythroxylum novogranatense]